jgi:hypothetical protein
MRQVLQPSKLLFLIAILSINACSANNPIETVKNGTLEIDRSVTVGGAFKGYDYFGNKNWKVFHDKQGRTFVQFKADILIPRNKVNILLDAYGKEFNYDKNNLEATLKEYYKNRQDFEKSFIDFLNKSQYIALFKIYKEGKEKFSLASCALVLTLPNHNPVKVEDGQNLMLESIFKNNLKLLAMVTNQFLILIKQDLSRLNQEELLNLKLGVEKIQEKIRAAHLNKDINQWLSCYSPSYPNLGRLENRMQEIWKNNDIKEVSYRISNVKPLGNNQASADIVWNIQVYDRHSHDYTLVRKNYRITLVRGSDGWKIRQSKELTGGPS